MRQPWRRYRSYFSQRRRNRLSVGRVIPLAEARMNLRICAALVGIACGGVMSSQGARAQQRAAVAPMAPVPSAISSAKRVFVSNGGADRGLFPHPFSGGTERGYNQLYVTLQGWGRYELETDPSDADLVLELQLIAPTGPRQADKQKGS